MVEGNSQVPQPADRRNCVEFSCGCGVHTARCTYQADPDQRPVYTKQHDLDLHGFVHRDPGVWVRFPVHPAGSDVAGCLRVEESIVASNSLGADAAVGETWTTPSS